MRRRHIRTVKSKCFNYFFNQRQLFRVFITFIMLRISQHSDELYRFVAVIYGKQILPAEVSKKLWFVCCEQIIWFAVSWWRY